MLRAGSARHGKPTYRGVLYCPTHQAPASSWQGSHTTKISGHSLHSERFLSCTQMALPPHSLHWERLLSCTQMAPPLHSLHWERILGEARRPSASRPKVWSTAPAVQTRICCAPGQRATGNRSLVHSSSCRNPYMLRAGSRARASVLRSSARCCCFCFMAGLDLERSPFAFAFAGVAPRPEVRSGQSGQGGSVEDRRSSLVGFDEFGGARRRSGHAKATLRHRLVDLCPLDAVKGTARASRLWPNWPNWPKRLVHSPFETCEQAQWVLR